ncbi:MAG: hypothetical protein H3C58_15440, partial [Fimbriimonadaceae bacterium]|nr:hypothetical protein [Fimbriimonadaceae bacterium]
MKGSLVRWLSISVFLATTVLGLAASGGPQRDDCPKPCCEHRDVSASCCQTPGDALQAERDGFDSVWVYDHLLYRFPDRPQFGIWEGWTILAALCE